MSTFLGPIHYWLFDKIKLVEAREQEIINAFVKSYGNEAASIIEGAKADYPPYLSDRSLAELIGNSSIHGFLAETIKNVEKREAAILAALIKKYGGKAKRLALEVTYNHGCINGRIARKEYEMEEPSAEAVNKVLKNYFLDGMPCDHVVELTVSSKNELVEKHTQCLHRGSWRSVGVSEVFMCEYLGRWIDGFVDGVGGYSHTHKKTIIKGDPYCEHVYTKRLR